MPLSPCSRCGARPPRILGLTSVVYGPLLERPLESGYFYLCHECYQRDIAPLIDYRAVRRSLRLRTQKPEDPPDF